MKRAILNILSPIGKMNGEHRTPKYILLTIILLVSSTAAIQAQDSFADGFNGLQETFNKKYDEAKKIANEALRLAWIYDNDIRMWMNAKFEGDEILMTEGKYHETSKQTHNIPLYYDEAESKGSMYAEFDWDNLAQSMHITSDATGGADAIRFKNSDILTIENKDSDQMQYTDKEGYWYVPGSPPGYAGTEEPTYIKLNAPKTLQGLFKGLEELSVAIKADEIAVKLIRLVEHMIFGFFHYGGIVHSPFLDSYDSPDVDPKHPFWSLLEDYYHNGVLRVLTPEEREFVVDRLHKDLKKELEGMLIGQNRATVGFPVFIHWALLYSPDSYKAEYGNAIKETPVGTFFGSPNCIKLTITSGENEKSFMIFDQFNRLVFINSIIKGKDEGTVRYAYDKDLTVNLPPAWDYENLMKNAINSTRPKKNGN